MSQKKSTLLLLLTLFTFNLTFSQDVQELEAERAINKNLKGEHPIVTLVMNWA